MSKVVLLAISAKYVHASLSVWILAGGIQRYAQLPHDVHIIESTINRPNLEIAESVSSLKPDVVGVSTYIWNAAKLPELLKLLRQYLPRAVFILGGPEASHNASYWLEVGADFVIRGEGEHSLPMLLDALAKGQPPPQEQPLPSDPPVDPYSDAYFDALAGRIAYLETSRGCPFKCTFCLSGGSNVRFFPLETAKEQITKLARSKTKIVKLIDRTFNCNPKRAYELFKHVIGLDTNCCFHFEVAADLFDKNTLELLATAPPGRIQLEVGLQSFFEPTLKATTRKTNLTKVEENIRQLLRQGNIHVHIDLIAGLPFETLADFKKGFNRAYALKAHTLQLGFLKLLHGSKLRQEAQSLGILYNPEPPYEILSNPWLNAEDLQTLNLVTNALQHTHNKGRFLSSLEYVLSASEIEPFGVFYTIGRAAPNHATDLADYAAMIYEICIKLPGVCPKNMRDHMIYDWLGMVKGKNLPTFLKSDKQATKQVAKAAEKIIGHKIARGEAAVLLSGAGIFVDSLDRDAVTELYKVHFIP